MNRHRRRWGALVAAVMVLAAAPTLGAPAQAADEPVVTERMAGGDRYATAAAIATDTFAAPVAEAVLARGDLYPDALTGTYLAGAIEGPVLLTPPTTLSSDALSALQALQVGTVHILGGTSAVSAAVEAELQGHGFSVNRIAGATRYETAKKIAETPAAGRIARLRSQRTVLLASGENFPDSIAAGSLAYRAGLPLLLTPSGSLAPEARAALQSLEVEHVVVLGGPAAIADSVLTSIEGIGGVTTRRVAGATRVETAVALADFALAELGWDARRASLARQDLFPDGLAAGPHAGRAFSVLLLTPPGQLASAVERWLHRHYGETVEVVAFGGEAAVGESTLAAAATAAETAGPNHAYEIDAEEETLNFGATRTCTVTTPRGATVHLRIVPAANAFTDGSGRTYLKDTDPADRRADADSPPSARIVRVGSTDHPGGVTKVDDVIVRTGAIEVAVHAAALDHAALVAFSDRFAGTDRELDLDATTLGVPFEPFGVGCDTRWFPPEAAQGQHTDRVVRRVDPAGSQVAAGPLGSESTYLMRPDDQFAVQDGPVTLTSFLDALGKGDWIDVDYQPNGTSTFNITFDTATVPGEPRASIAGSDMHLWWVPPGDNGTGTTFRVQRVHGTANCSSATGTVTWFDPVAAPPFVDKAVPAGCYWYRVWPLSSEGASPGFRQSDAVSLPQPDPEADRPISTGTTTDDQDPVGVVSGRDVFTITFDEPMAKPRAGTRITLRDAELATATLVHGSNALFTLGSTGTTLTIALTRDPPSVAKLPASIISHVGVTDLAGNSWDISASDAAGKTVG